MDKPEALFLADELEAPLGTVIGAELYRRAAEELRRLHAENASLSAALASSCDEQRHALWESGGIAGCERARVAERQRDALLEVLLGVEKRCSHSGYVGNDGQFLKVIQAAIAKATGETA